VQYTIGVKRRWLPGYRTYRVKGHTTECVISSPIFNPDGKLNRVVEIQVKPRLALTLIDDSRVIIPEIDTVEWKVYPDYALELVKQIAKRSDEAASQAKDSMTQAASQPVL
jgi:hypothetical protein